MISLIFECLSSQASCRLHRGSNVVAAKESCSLIEHTTAAILSHWKLIHLHSDRPLLLLLITAVGLKLSNLWLAILTLFWKVFWTDPFTFQQSNYSVQQILFKADDKIVFTKGICISLLFHKWENMNLQESRGAQPFLLFNLTVIHPTEENISKLFRAPNTGSLN